MLERLDYGKRWTGALLWTDGKPDMLGFNLWDATPEEVEANVREHLAAHGPVRFTDWQGGNGHYVVRLEFDDVTPAEQSARSGR